MGFASKSDISLFDINIKKLATWLIFLIQPRLARFGQPRLVNVRGSNTAKAVQAPEGSEVYPALAGKTVILFEFICLSNSGREGIAPLCGVQPLMRFGQRFSVAKTDFLLYWYFFNKLFIFCPPLYMSTIFYFSF